MGKVWSNKLRRTIQSYEFEVGVLEDKPHRLPKERGLLDTPELGSYAGGPIQKMSRLPGERSVGEVLTDNMKRLNINILLRPFQEKNADIIKFTTYFLKLVLKRGDVSIKRVENLLQAIVRNPILKQEYGPNRASTADAKGFNRHMFGTGQMFKAIRAKARIKGR